MQKIPQHIAVIMDGNGRWAKQRNQERIFGHHQGAESAKVITESAVKYGIKYLTIYAFSKENWKRSEKEVSGLMNMLIKGVNENLDKINDLDVKVRLLGDYATLPQDVKEAVDKTLKSTSTNTGLILNIALNYGGRWEITNAVKEISKKVVSGDIKIEEINELTISNNMLISETPDPDLLIRTSGEYRISNFLLWQLSYTELYFTNVLWPDFREEHFLAALKEYQNRNRRFGETLK